MINIFEPHAKLLWHGDRVATWLKTGRTNPILIEVAPSGYCNAKCPWCFFKNNKSSSQINSATMISAIHDMARLGVKAINWTGGGEPILHPDFEKFVYYTSECGLKQGLFTNGYKVIPFQEKFEWIRISLTDKGFSKIKRPKVPFGICVNQTKNHSKKDLKKLCFQARNFGARYFQIRPALVGNYKNQPLLSVPLYLKEHRKKNFEVYITGYKYEDAVKPKNYRYCYGYHFCPSIDWNGKVNVCLYLASRKKYALGDLNKERLLKIWPNIIKQTKVTDECQNCCKNNEINKILYAAKNVKSVDFI